jgi:hypothetical protein
MWRTVKAVVAVLQLVVHLWGDKRRRLAEKEVRTAVLTGPSGMSKISLLVKLVFPTVIVNASAMTKVNTW